MFSGQAGPHTRPPPSLRGHSRWKYSHKESSLQESGVGHDNGRNALVAFAKEAQDDPLCTPGGVINPMIDGDDGDDKPVAAVLVTVDG